jgi:hypothetical protein
MKAYSLLISLSLCILICYVIDSYWGAWLSKQTSEKQIWILNKNKQEYDIAFLGSSRVFTCIDAGTISKKTDRRAINLGCDGASLMENYVVLSQFLANGNKVDSIYLQLDNTSLSNMKKALSYPFHDYLFLNKLNNEEVKEAIIEDKGKLKFYLWKYLPLFKYAEFNTFFNLSFLNPFETKKTDPFDFNSGSKLIEANMPDSLFLRVSHQKFKSDTFRYDKTSLMYIDKILSLCNENKIKCHFFKVPIYKAEFESYRSSHQTSEYLRQLAVQKSCNFYDFQNLELSGNRIYFKDCSHLNAEGVKIFSAILCDTLFKQFPKNQISVNYR